MTPDAETRAAMVEAAETSRNQDAKENNRGSWHHETISRMLTAAILALEERGGKVTMRDATMEMAEAGTYITSVFGPRDTSERWTRMHNAAPGWENV
jgi:hypothetical protein